MIPQEINGNPVRFVARLATPVLPRDYPGDGGLEPTTAFLISFQSDDDADSEAFWLSCLGRSGRVMAGDMCYTLESAKNYPKSEFDIPQLDWQEL
jgi:hypothetical protein